MLSFLKKLFGQETLDYSALMNRGAIIIDVRTPLEYSRGHVSESINLPLNEIRGNITEIKKQNKPIITCCRSGARSGSAASILKNAGIEAYNGGSWNQVNRALSN